jgi:hypothetical protein
MQGFLVCGATQFTNFSLPPTIFFYPSQTFVFASKFKFRKFFSACLVSKNIFCFFAFYSQKYNFSISVAFFASVSAFFPFLCVLTHSKYKFAPKSFLLHSKFKFVLPVLLCHTSKFYVS